MMKHYAEKHNFICMYVVGFDPITKQSILLQGNFCGECKKQDAKQNHNKFCRECM